MFFIQNEHGGYNNFFWILDSIYVPTDNVWLLGFWKKREKKGERQREKQNVPVSNLHIVLSHLRQKQKFKEAIYFKAA